MVFHGSADLPVVFKFTVSRAALVKNRFFHSDTETEATGSFAPEDCPFFVPILPLSPLDLYSTLEYFPYLFHSIRETIS